KRLSSIDGGNKEKLKIALPEDLIKPTSKLSVDFRLDARERRSCSRVTDQQLWGTMHADTNFELKRATAVQLPDLKLLQTGFPFSAPQDLSSTAVVLPKEPSIQELGTLLEFSKRLGRISKADSMQLEVYTVDNLPKEKREKRHLVGIGSRKTFPFPEVLNTGDFDLKEQLVRQRNLSEIQTNPDNDGVIKEIISPYSKERALLALTSQTDKGLEQVQSLLRLDSLFFQLKEDTALISAKDTNPDISDANAYAVEFLQREKRVKIEKTPLSNKFFQILANSWFLLGPAIIASGIILYGIIQLFYIKTNFRRKKLTGDVETWCITD
ncbi:MAG: cellulose biosynthesis cyclic di-GMP-binding regulatory protein BcsB, partial [Potamolinea sp.]